MAERTIRHGIFSWEEGGSRRMAFHGQTVDIKDEKVLERGDRKGAFFEKVGQERDLSKFGALQPLSSDPSDEELKAWLAAGTADEVLAEAPRLADATIAKLATFEEKRSGQPRTHLIEALRSSIKAQPSEAGTEAGGGDGQVDELLNLTVKDFEKKAGDFTPELLERLAAAEAGRPEPRKGVLKAIEDARAASKPEE